MAPPALPCSAALNVAATAYTYLPNNVSADSAAAVLAAQLASLRTALNTVNASLGASFASMYRE